MSEPETVPKDELTLHLRDYLTPGGRYPYERLPGDMMMALSRGCDVMLLSVPGFLMVWGSALLAKEGRRAWSSDRRYYATAYEALRGIHGTKNPTLLVKPVRKTKTKKEETP
jgi:hypothetical protein